MVRTLPKIELKKTDILIWHYTSPEVFWKILEGELYATHYRFLNDSKEIEYGLDAFEKVLSALQKELPYAVNILKYIRQQDSFLFCFSKECDSLAQWRAYTPGGGVSIGFSYNEIAMLLNSYSVPVTEQFYNFALHDCKYCNRSVIERYVRYVTYLIVNKKRSACRCLLEDNDTTRIQGARFDGDFSKGFTEEIQEQIKSPQFYNDVLSATVLLDQLSKRSLSFKNPSFRLENECRLTVQGENYKREIEMIGGKPRIRIRLDGLLTTIKEVYVSPHGEPERNEILANIAKERFGLNFKIRRSLSSFNGH